MDHPELVEEFNDALLKCLSYITDNHLHSPELLNGFTGNQIDVIERPKENDREIHRN